MTVKAAKDVLKVWVIEALNASNGQAHHIDVAKYIWSKHRDDLEALGDLFFTWQYDLRWAADELRREGWLLPKPKGAKGPWQLARTT